MHTLNSVLVWLVKEAPDSYGSPVFILQQISNQDNVERGLSQVPALFIVANIYVSCFISKIYFTLLSEHTRRIKFMGTS